MTQAQAKLAEPSAPQSTRASSFYAAMRIMPVHQRSAMYEIYHYCRVLDDIADEEGNVEERLDALQIWRRNIDELYSGKTPAGLEALAKAVADFKLRKEDMLALIDGMGMDVVGPIQSPDMATLELYCDRVACAVGRLSVRVFGMQEEDGIALSHHLGTALQLTNILRDLDEDAGINRLYLPKELLEEAGIKDNNPALVLSNPAIVGVCRKLADKAFAHFGEADKVMKRYERKIVRTPRIMSEAYHTILTSLLGRGFSSPRRPVRLNKIKLGVIVARNMLF